VELSRCLECDTASQSWFGASFSTSAEETFAVGDDISDEIDDLPGATEV
jgi:hypothetical protein